jgi:hypothetical protein
MYPYSILIAIETVFLLSFILISLRKGNRVGIFGLLGLASMIIGACYDFTRIGYFVSLPDLMPIFLV